MSRPQKRQRPAKRNAVRYGRKVEEGNRVRYGVVGLGHIAQEAVLPAFANAGNNSVLAALISDNDEKRNKLGKNYGVTRLYDYDELEVCIERERLDAVYIALPNSLHRSFVRRAADCGAHVLCEKPLGVSARECREMDRAARRNRVYLMTAYRLHFDEANMRVVELITRGEIGDPKIFTSVLSFQLAKENIRLESELGGGALFDIGVYPVNAARYVFQDEPRFVVSQLLDYGDKRFSEVEGTATAMMVFPGEKIAHFTSSFAAGDCSFFEVVGTKGKIRLENAYEYSEGSTLFLENKKKKSRREFKRHDQFSAEILYFSDCILNGKEPEPSALEAEKDLIILEAIRESAERKLFMKLETRADKFYPNEHQIIRRPPPRRKSKLIRVSAPHMNGADSHKSKIGAR